MTGAVVSGMISWGQCTEDLRKAQALPGTPSEFAFSAAASSRVAADGTAAAEAILQCVDHFIELAVHMLLCVGMVGWLATAVVSAALSATTRVLLMRPQTPLMPASCIR